MTIKAKKNYCLFPQELLYNHWRIKTLIFLMNFEKTWVDRNEILTLENFNKIRENCNIFQNHKLTNKTLIFNGQINCCNQFSEETLSHTKRDNRQKAQRTGRGYQWCQIQDSTHQGPPRSQWRSSPSVSPPPSTAPPR